ncbi:hypothetical protein A3860_22570 [Niastella vici]|uniref:Uncharacterized protein n=1 Tax=Niastella vici TaxID=1703345 RepID=A0A1V9FZD3_9BACT|nr:RteC domain-containing protein [Niastella vici]OQP63729.1 hypothetical protein A3860_22570 [Niastella vici]
MKNSFLLQQSRLLYKIIWQKIQSSESQSADEKKWIECAFVLTTQAWLNIEKVANDYQFMNKQEEVCFYKSQKPRFTGLIDYFTLLYKSVLFQPEDYTKREVYWKRELDTCITCISSFKTACLNYQLLQSDTDTCFLQCNNQGPLLFGNNAGMLDLKSTSYSCLLGRLIALKKYKKYIQEKLYNEIPLRQTG